jgi:hypothetical protein
MNNPQAGNPVAAPRQTSESLSASHYQPSGQAGAFASTAPASLFGNGNNTKPRLSSSMKLTALVFVGLAAVLVGFLIFSGNDDAEPTQTVGVSEETESDSNSGGYAPSDNYRSWDDYPEAFRSSFMDACTSEASYELCFCTLEIMEEMYTYEEAELLVQAGSNGEDITWFYNSIVAECI